MTFTLTSTAFAHKDMIPALYTCTGENISPPLSWIDAPEGTKSFVLLMEDLDVPLGKLTHWILYNISPEIYELPENIPHNARPINGIFQGKNSMRKQGYMGPCPPFGKHRYLFTLSALDCMIDYDENMNKRRLMKVIEGHVLDTSKLMGFYKKK